MKLIRHALISGVALVALAASALAQEAPAFMIIRFNQPRMYYDQQLYNAVSKAVSIKQDVMFEIIAYAPVTGDESNDNNWRQQAQRDLANVISRMNSIGVPSSRIMTSVQAQQGLRFDEVHLFAH